MDEDAAAIDVKLKLSEARCQSLCKVHRVMESQLVTAQLGAQAHALVKGKHNKRTTAFVKATMAACYVTIPTSDNIITRLRLFLLCGQVSLLNALITQAESFMKQCIQTIKELPMILDMPQIDETTEQNVASFLGDLMDALVCMPGHPENGPHYLTTALCSVIVRMHSLQPGQTHAWT